MSKPRVTRVHTEQYIINWSEDFDSNGQERPFIHVAGKPAAEGCTAYTACYRTARAHWGILDYVALQELGVSRGACKECLDNTKAIWEKYFILMEERRKRLNPEMI